MLKTNKQTLVILSALVWYIGGIMLFRGGVELIREAQQIKPGIIWPGIFIVGGIVLGIIQALTLFTRSCRRNIQRISQLKDPRLWMFFRPGFFLALGIMITTGILLDLLSKGNYFFMLAVAGVDFALTISLLGSSYVFWTEKLPPNHKD
jgi:hypothetical protein